MSAPQVRASWLKYTLRFAKRQGGGLGERLMHAAGDALRDEIYHAGPLGWLPAASFIQLCASVREAYGTDGARDFWRESLRSAIDQPLIRPLAHGGLFLFGRTPLGLYRRTPQSWALVTRNMGEMVAEDGPHERSVWLKVRGLPIGCRNLALLGMWEGGFVGEAAFLGERARVETDASGLAQGRSDFLVQW